MGQFSGLPTSSRSGPYKLSGTCRLFQFCIAAWWQLCSIISSRGPSARRVKRSKGSSSTVTPGPNRWSPSSHILGAYRDGSAAIWNNSSGVADASRAGGKNVSSYSVHTCPGRFRSPSPLSRARGEASDARLAGMRSLTLARLKRWSRASEAAGTSMDVITGYILTSCRREPSRRR